MLLVTGGADGSWDHSDTTETFDPLVGSWVASGAKLPRPMYYLRAVNINDRLLIFGNDSLKSRLQYPNKIVRESLKCTFTYNQKIITESI